MPLFEYICSACQKKFEKLIYGGEENISCPACAGTSVATQFSTFSSKSSSSSGASAPSGCAGKLTDGCGGGRCGR